MPWTAQGSKNETYIPSEPMASARVYSNGGEQIFALNGLPVFASFAVDSLWIKQARESEVWI